jgi:hypothetical protein
MQSLITENNLTFSKPKCNCGLVSTEDKKHYSKKQNKSKSKNIVKNILKNILKNIVKNKK